MAIKRWTDEEIEFLKEHCPISGVNYVAEKLGRTAKAVGIKASRLNISCFGGNWTKEEDSILKKYYPIEGSKGVSERINRTREAIIQRASMFNLESGALPSSWTEKEEAILIKYYPTKGTEWCAKKLKRTDQAVRARASMLNIKAEYYNWTEKEDMFIRNFYPTKSLAWCAKRLSNRTEVAINNRAHALGVKRANFYWTEEDVNYLKENYGYKSPSEIAKKLNRTRVAIIDKAREFNLKFVRGWTEEEVEYLVDNINHVPYKVLCDYLKRTRFDVYRKTKELNIKVDYYDDGYYYGTADIAYILDIKQCRVLRRLKTSNLRVSNIKMKDKRARCYRFTPADIIRFLYKNQDLWVDRLEEIDKYEINTLCLDDTVKRRAYKECNFVISVFNDTYWRKTAKLKADKDVLPDDVAI